MIEAKVKASTSVAALSGLALWALGRYVFKGSVPDVVASWVYVIVPGVLTFAAGYLARHTNRPAEVPAPAITTAPPPAEKTLAPPAATEPQPPAAAGPKGT